MSEWTNGPTGWTNGMNQQTQKKKTPLAVGVRKTERDDAAHPRRVHDFLQLLTRHRVPHAHVRATAELSRGNPLAVGMHRQTLDVVVVSEEKTLTRLSLFELIFVQHHPHRGGVIDDFPRAQVKQVGRRLVAVPSLCV